MSRLDFMISRLTAQRALLDEAARLIADQPGCVFELGLGSGRTFDHLRQLLPDREIFAFDRAISAHPKCIPDGDHMILGEIRETLKFCGPRIPGKARLHPRRPRLRRSDAGPDHALLAVAARRRMVGARHDRPRRPAARRELPRAAAAAGLPEVRATCCCAPNEARRSGISKRMRIAFYAPLKPPDHPVASGDRAMARALIAALERAGHEVTLASRFRSYDRGDARAPGAAARRWAASSRDRSAAEASSAGAWRPDLWFTYHLYHKAPDWLGPLVAARLGIPYVVAEASYAPKQAGGRWDLGHRAVAEAIAARRPHLPAESRRRRMRAAAARRAGAAGAAAAVPRHGAVPRAGPRGEPRRDRRAASASIRASRGSLTVAMMRDDQKLALLSRARRRAVATSPICRGSSIIAGAGPAESEVRAAFAPLGERVRWVGMLDRDTLRQLYRAADLYRLAGGQGGVRHGAARGAGGGAAGRRRPKRRRAGDRRRRRDRPARAGRRRGRLRRGGRGAARRSGAPRSAWARPRCGAPRATTTSPPPRRCSTGISARLDGRGDDPAPRHPPRRDRLERGRADPGPHRPPAQRGRARASSRRARCPTDWAGAHCLSSPLARAMETARLLGLDPQPEPRLIEMAWGEWEGQSLAELRARARRGDGARTRRAASISARPAARARATCRRACGRCSPSSDAPTIFVTHKGVLRALYALATGWTMTRKAAAEAPRRPRASLSASRADGTPSVVRAEHSARARVVTRARALLRPASARHRPSEARRDPGARRWQRTGLDVTVALGGRPIPGSSVPRRAASPQLPPAPIAGEDFSDAPRRRRTSPSTTRWKAARRDALLDLHRDVDPDVVLIELFPFGRRQFALRAPAASRSRPRADARDHRSPARCATSSSLRRSPGARRRSSRRLRRFFDAVLVHGDPALIPFGATFARRDADRRPDPLHRLCRRPGADADACRAATARCSSRPAAARSARHSSSRRSRRAR